MKRSFPMPSFFRAGFAAACFALLVAGCGLLPEVKEETAGWSADRLYKTAHDTMLEGNYIRAIKLFDQLEARFPYGRYAQQAILESAYANWRGGEQAAAIAATERFIRTYPNHPNVDYAYYLKGLVHFREDQGILGYVYELDLAERDPKEMRASFAAFKELTTRFPDSTYYQDSIARMSYLNNAMSTYEVNVARYYYRRGAYVAAANRAQESLINFPRTAANESALDIMKNSYEKLGLQQLATDSKQILVKTFPESKYVVGGGEIPWWNFWERNVERSQESYGVTPTRQLATKPWWQFWD